MSQKIKMKEYRYNIVVITTVFFISSVAYTESDIQQSDILAFDPSRACDVLAMKLEKMQVALDKKKLRMTKLYKGLMSAATTSADYGDIRSDYIKTSDKFKSMKKDYNQLVLERENNCMPDQDNKNMD